MTELIAGMFIGALGLAIVYGVTRKRDKDATLKLRDKAASQEQTLRFADDEGFSGEPEDIMRLIHAGHKIEAIKAVRLMTGLDLVHAKELVEKMAKGDAVDLPARKK